jgi:hypothetical protein
VLQVKVLQGQGQVKALLVKVLQVKVQLVKVMSMELLNIHQMYLSSSIHMIDT